MHAPAQRPPSIKTRQRADNEKLLQEIASFCRRVGMAESTFGRRAVNDGKFVTRLRFGGRVTTHTVERVRGFMARILPVDWAIGKCAARKNKPRQARVSIALRSISSWVRMTARLAWKARREPIWSTRSAAGSTLGAATSPSAFASGLSGWYSGI